jgi:hypothetical protein
MPENNFGMFNKLLISFKKNWILWGAFLLAAGIIFVFRFPFIHSPYGYDQSVFIYEGKALFQGEIPYKDVWDQRPLGMGYIIAFLYQIGLSSLVQINLFEIFWIILSVLGFLVMAQKIIKHQLAVGMATVFFAALLADYSFMGGSNEGYIEIHLLLPIIILIYAAYAYWKKTNPMWLILIGLATFGAFMIRLTSIDFLVPVFLFLFYVARDIYREKWVKRFIASIVITAAAFLVPLGFYLLYLWEKGALLDFYNAVIGFNAYYGSALPDLKAANVGLFSKALYSVVNLSRHISTLPLTYLLAILGVAAMFRKYNKFNFFLLLFFVFSLINIAAGLKPWPHYFIQVYPLVALLAGLVFKVLYEEIWPLINRNNQLRFTIVAVVLLFFVFPYVLKPFVSSLGKLQTDKNAFDNNLNQLTPDPVVVYARDHNWAGQRAVYWTNFSYYLDTKMLSSTRYFSDALANFWGLPNLFATPDRINEVVKDLKAKPPKIIVLDTSEFQLGSLVWAEDSPLRKYIESHYEIEPTLSHETIEVFVKK